MQPRPTPRSSAATWRSHSSLTDTLHPLWMPSGGGWQLRFVWYVDDEEPDWAVVERTAKERPLRGRAGGQL